LRITSGAEIRRVNQVRRAVFGGADEAPLKHLGEAVRYARFQRITTRETIDLMTIAVVNGEIAAQKAYDLMLTMADKDRSLRLPSSPGQFEG
jgi:hypothetical protein